MIYRGLVAAHQPRFALVWWLHVRSPTVSIEVENPTDHESRKYEKQKKRSDLPLEALKRVTNKKQKQKCRSQQYAHVGKKTQSTGSHIHLPTHSVSTKPLTSTFDGAFFRHYDWDGWEDPKNSERC